MNRQQTREDLRFRLKRLKDAVAKRRMGVHCQHQLGRGRGALYSTRMWNELRCRYHFLRPLAGLRRVKAELDVVLAAPDERPGVSHRAACRRLHKLQNNNLRLRPKAQRRSPRACSTRGKKPAYCRSGSGHRRTDGRRGVPASSMGRIGQYAYAPTAVMKPPPPLKACRRAPMKVIRPSLTDYR